MFYLLRVDDINFAPPDEKVYKGNGASDVIVFVPSNNGGLTKAHVEESGNDPDGVLIT